MLWMHLWWDHQNRLSERAINLAFNSSFILHSSHQLKQTKIKLWLLYFLKIECRASLNISGPIKARGGNWGLYKTRLSGTFFLVRSARDVNSEEQIYTKKKHKKQTLS